MNAFALAADTLFGDQNLALDALWRAGGAGPGVAIRSIRRSLDRALEFGDGRFVKVGMRMQVRVDSINFKRRQVDLELLTPLPTGPRKGAEGPGGGGGRQGFEKLRTAARHGGGKKAANGKPSGGGHGKKSKGGLGGKKKGGGRSRR